MLGNYDGWGRAAGLLLLGLLVYPGQRAAGAVLGQTSFEEAAAGNTTGYSPGVGGMELAWALTAGAVNDPDDIQIVSGGASAGQQFLSVRDTDSDVNGGNLALSFADVDVSQASSVTVSVDILVGVGTWNTTDFVAFGFAVGGNNHTLVEIVGLDMDTVEGAGWMTFSTTVDTLGADWITDIQFQFRGAHAGDDVALDQLIFTADLVEEPPMDDPPMDDPPMDDPPSSEIPEPATGLVWLILAGLSAGSWCRRLRRAMVRRRASIAAWSRFNLC